MREYEDITSALRAVQRHWQSGYTCWVAFIVGADKVPTIGVRWAEELGTGLPAWKRQDRKQRHLANAVALSSPVLGRPGVREIMLMATPDALTMPDVSPWRRQKWQQRCPELSAFVMLHEPRPRGDYAWTWRLQEHVAVGVARHFTSLVKESDGSAVAKHTHHAVSLYPMFGGVRRQLKRILHSARKLWVARTKSSWPGPDPDHLPAMIGFKAAKVAPARKTSLAAPRKPDVCAAETAALAKAAADLRRPRGSQPRRAKPAATDYDPPFHQPTIGN